MTVARIIRFAVDPSSTPTSTNEAIQNAIEAIKIDNVIEPLVIGSKVQDGSLQITSQHTSTPSSTSIASFLSNLNLGTSTSILHAHLTPSVLPAPLSAPVVEYALSSFPSSLVTPSFKQQIEAYLTRFDALFGEGVELKSGMLATGWVVEERVHAGEGGKEEWGSRAFLAVRGWESMGAFEEAVKTEAFGRAIPILLG